MTSYTGANQVIKNKGIDSNFKHTSIYIISPSKVTATISVGVFPRGIVVKPITGNVYVGNEGSKTVSVISPATIQGFIGTIDNFHLPRDVTTSLEASLNAAIIQLNRHNNVAAYAQLNAFINQVNAQLTWTANITEGCRFNTTSNIHTACHWM
jgi:hypothetical protein